MKDVYKTKSLRCQYSDTRLEVLGFTLRAYPCTHRPI
jgi:hypothetical protein